MFLDKWRREDKWWEKILQILKGYNHEKILEIIPSQAGLELEIK